MPPNEWPLVSREGRSSSILVATIRVSDPDWKAPKVALPTFSAFADTRVTENQVDWRGSHRRTMMDILNSHLRPVFGEMGLGEITKAEILAFRSQLAKVARAKG